MSDTQVCYVPVGAIIAPATLFINSTHEYAGGYTVKVNQNDIGVSGMKTWRIFPALVIKHISHLGLVQLLTSSGTAVYVTSKTCVTIVV